MQSEVKYGKRRDSHFVRTIPLPTLGIRTTEFDLSRKKSDNLYEAGRKAAEEFFQSWDFNAYKARYRQKETLKRRQRIL
ncbi:MAG: hypothetical protein SVY10_18075 [Thermodesulfobacteriota bacterium]|nr:hypothetical protein [Thermodesulfobacteriota bacterium]